jgi:hypothetical protein
MFDEYLTRIAGLFEEHSVLDVLRELLSSRACIAGGSVLYAMLGIETQDVDIWCFKGHYQECIDIVVKALPDVKVEHQNSKVTNIFPSGRVKLQLIKCNFSSPRQVVSYFDLDYVKCALFNGKVISTISFQRAIADRRIYEACQVSTSRLKKALSKGFRTVLYGNLASTKSKNYKELFDLVSTTDSSYQERDTLPEFPMNKIGAKLFAKEPLDYEEENLPQIYKHRYQLSNGERCEWFATKLTFVPDDNADALVDGGLILAEDCPMARVSRWITSKVPTLQDGMYDVAVYSYTTNILRTKILILEPSPEGALPIYPLTEAQEEMLELYDLIKQTISRGKFCSGVIVLSIVSDNLVRKSPLV